MRNRIEAGGADCPEARLLRGHVAQSLHRFKEAESIARGLVAVGAYQAPAGRLELATV